MNGPIKAFAVGHGDPAEGIEVIVEEPNGDQILVRCICLDEQTVIEGDGNLIEYFHERYGERTFSMTVREAALRAAESHGPE
ncbi:MAG: hypothetical protein HRF45_10270 [Fimbriimonadia bacterium]|jgi:hypothetical protein